MKPISILRMPVSREFVGLVVMNAVLIGFDFTLDALRLLAGISIPWEPWLFGTTLMVDCVIGFAFSCEREAWRIRQRSLEDLQFWRESFDALLAELTAPPPSVPR